MCKAAMVIIEFLVGTEALEAVAVGLEGPVKLMVTILAALAAMALY